MLYVVKSPEAETDFEDIWLYSFEKWSEDQADRYYDELIDGINKLIDNPMLGKSREYVRRDYRSLQINRHVIYYRLQGEVIDIVRVLHEHMAPEQHL